MKFIPHITDNGKTTTTTNDQIYNKKNHALTILLVKENTLEKYFSKTNKKKIIFGQISHLVTLTDLFVTT